VSVLPTTNTDHGVTERLTSGTLDDNTWAQKAGSQLYTRNVPLLHMSTKHSGTSLYMISFTRPSPALVLQAMNSTKVQNPQCYGGAHSA